jgi:hypothetical protein
MKVYSGYPGEWLVPLDRVGVICYGTEITSDVNRGSTVGKQGVHGPYRAHPYNLAGIPTSNGVRCSARIDTKVIAAVRMETDLSRGDSSLVCIVVSCDSACGR